MAPRVRLGELLVEAQIITRAQLDEILAVQQSDPRRLGTLLVETGLITETQVTQILSQQLSVPWVSLYHIDFSRQLLNLVPRELAEKYCLVPIFVRRVRGLGDALYIAMDDPSDDAAQREVAQFSGLPVRTMIAPPSDIKAALRAYYGTLRPADSDADASEPLERLSQPGPVKMAQAEPPMSIAATAAARAAAAAPPAASAAVAPAASAAAPPAASAAVAPAASAAAPPAAVAPPASVAAPDTVAAREASMPVPKRGRGARMITLTMLDGTRIKLPAKGGAKSQNVDEEQLTARDLVAALRAASHGAETDDILGDNKRWEKLFAALLALLMKKHLIADWEFIEELKRI